VRDLDGLWERGAGSVGGEQGRTGRGNPVSTLVR
jgi:hypothetical protein